MSTSNINSIYSFLRKDKQKEILKELKSTIDQLTKMIIKENTSFSSKSGLEFGFEINNKLSERIDLLTDMVILNIGEKNTSHYNSLFFTISQVLESLISKSVSNSFYKQYINEYSNQKQQLISKAQYSQVNNENNKENIINPDKKSISIQLMTYFLPYKSKTSIENKQNPSQPSEKKENHQLTFLFLQEEIFKKKCKALSFLKLSDFEIVLEDNVTNKDTFSQEDLKIFSNFKCLTELNKVNSSKDKLKVLISVIDKIVFLINSDNFDKIMKFLIILLIKIDIPYIKTTSIYIKTMTLKNLLTSKEEYYLNILIQAIGSIEKVTNSANEIEKNYVFNLVKSKNERFYDNLHIKIKSDSMILNDSLSLQSLQSLQSFHSGSIGSISRRISIINLKQPVENDFLEKEEEKESQGNEHKENQLESIFETIELYNNNSFISETCMRECKLNIQMLYNKYFLSKSSGLKDKSFNECSYFEVQNIYKLYREAIRRLLDLKNRKKK